MNEDEIDRIIADANAGYTALHEAVAVAEVKAASANLAHAKDRVTLLALIAALGDPDEYDVVAGAISTGGQLWRATAVDLLARVARATRAATAELEGDDA